MTMEKPDNSFAHNLVNIRGRRAMATLLTALEKEVKPHLSQQEWENVRSKVLQVLGDFQDFCMDMIKAETGAINEIWAEKIGEIHEAVGAGRGQ